MRGKKKVAVCIMRKSHGDITEDVTETNETRVTNDFPQKFAAQASCIHFECSKSH